MKPEFVEYLGNIAGMGTPFIERVREIHEQCAALNNNEFETLFISNSLASGNMAFGGLHLFSAYHIYSCKDILAPLNIQITQTDRISTCELSTSNFNLKTRANEKGSKLVINVRWEPTSAYMLLHAVELNCTKLADILYKILVPKITSA